MTWTKNKPTVSDKWYWYSKNKNNKQCILLYLNSKGEYEFQGRVFPSKLFNIGFWSYPPPYISRKKLTN
jgi:hypothetical protein